MTEFDDLNQIFRIADSDGTGFLDKEKLHRICPHLSQTEVEAIFHDFDTNRDHRISFKEFAKGYEKYLQPTENRFQTEMTPIEMSEVFNHLSCQEQIYEFYETLQRKSSDSIEQFQSILEIFVSDVLKYRKEIQRLEDSYRREKEMNENFLKRLEEDQEREMRQFEEKIRKEEQMKFETERELIQQRAAKQISDLQANVQRLQSIEKCYLDRQSNEESLVVLLREEISKLTQENQTLNSVNNDSLTTIAILKSDLQSLKTQLNERQTMFLQEKQSLSINYREKESLQTNVRQLVEVNKNLRDENDALRAMLDSNKSTSNLSDVPKNARRAMSRAGSVLEAYWNPNSYDKHDHETPLNSSMIQFQTEHGDLDLESADELDSGLSLTTVRDATEIESDRESKQNSSLTLKNSKANRSIVGKRQNHESDSDDVFAENSIDRANFKRSSQQRSMKNIRSSIRSAAPIARSISPRISNEINQQQESPESNLPFDRMYKVVFCGDAAVGKSTLIMRLCKGKFVSNINSTLGVDFQNKQLDLDGKRIAIQLWDTAGQERFRSIAKSYFRRCDGVILVYDSTYERSFLNVREWIDTINESTSKKVSVMIVANKVDLRDQSRREGKRVVEHDDGAKLAKEYQALFIETSAKEGTNANETLIELARDMQCNEDLERYRNAGIDLDKSSKKSSCCSTRS